MLITPRTDNTLHFNLYIFWLVGALPVMLSTPRTDNRPVSSDLALDYWILHAPRTERERESASYEQAQPHVSLAHSQSGPRPMLVKSLVCRIPQHACYQYSVLGLGQRFGYVLLYKLHTLHSALPVLFFTSHQFIHAGKVHPEDFFE